MEGGEEGGGGEGGIHEKERGEDFCFSRLGFFDHLFADVLVFSSVAVGPLRRTSLGNSAECKIPLCKTTFLQNSRSP